MKQTFVGALGLPDEVNKHWDQYFAELQLDGTEHDLRPLARFVLGARKHGLDMDGSHIDLTVPIDEWGAMVIEQTYDFVSAMNAVLDVLEDESAGEVKQQ